MNSSQIIQISFILDSKVILDIIFGLNLDKITNIF